MNTTVIKNELKMNTIKEFNNSIKKVLTEILQKFNIDFEKCTYKVNEDKMMQLIYKNEILLEYREPIITKIKNNAHCYTFIVK